MQYVVVVTAASESRFRQLCHVVLPMTAWPAHKPITAQAQPHTIMNQIVNTVKETSHCLHQYLD